MAVAILSPHFDDAVLSCWHVLSRPGPVVVVNVFAGAPAGGAPGWWDRTTGAADAGSRVRQRAAEDRRVLSSVGGTQVNLDLLEHQHRREAADVAEIAGRVRDAVGRCDTVYAPCGIGAHADHVLVRDAALRLAADGARVRLYADLPHAVRRGWPTWVEAGGDPAADAAWTAALRALRGMAPRAQVRALDPGERRRKLVAVRHYGTQVAALERWFGPLEPVLRYEVTWDLTPA